MKRTETIELEQGLEKLAKEKRWYGCEEITIGFYEMVMEMKSVIIS